MFLLQVDDSDVKYRSLEEEEASPASPVGMSCWDSFSSTPFGSENSQNRSRSSPHRGPRGSRGLGPDNHKEANPGISPPSPSFPSSSLASAVRLFEGAQRRRSQTGPPLSPALKHGGCSLTEANPSLR